MTLPILPKILSLMHRTTPYPIRVAIVALFLATTFSSAHIGQRFPSEKKIVTDPVTGIELTFLTSTPAGDSKIYPTHPQWTADGEWLIFRSNRVPGEAMAVNEATGDLVQVTEGGYQGMLTIARKSMYLYVMRRQTADSDDTASDRELVEIDLDKLFADSAAGELEAASAYQRVCGIIPAELGAGGDMALDANEDVVYFRIGREAAARHLDESVEPEPDFGPRGMGAGPTGLARMDLSSGEIEHVVSVPFQMGHVQANPWVPGEIVFSWETGGKSPQRTWTVMADGTGLRPLYPEADYEWVTHEAVITKDEVAFAIMGHRDVRTNDAWGPSGTREKPTGLGIVNLRTREMHIAGQTESGSGLWHVHGSADGRWAVGDDFSRSLYLIDRHTSEMRLLTTGHKPSAADHVHPTFNADGTKIQIQSAMLSEDDRSMNICIVPVPEDWLNRTYESHDIPEGHEKTH